jgi:hypothetical protein
MTVAPPFPWMLEKPDTFRYHLENDTGTFDEYTRRKRLDLGKSLLKLRRIYLDTKYWLYVRDVYLNRPQKPVHADVLNELRRLRSSGSTICPMSYSVLMELLNQSDAKTRSATAAMIDELSDDCTIQPPNEVFRRELFHFVTKFTSLGKPLLDVAHMVWTKASFVLGDVFLSLDGSGITEPRSTAFRKAMDDALWATKLSEMIQALPPNDTTEKPIAEKLAATLTDQKFIHKKDGDTFDKLFLDEIDGIMDVYSDICGDLMVHMARERGIGGEIRANETLASGRMLGKLIHAAFKNGRLTSEFPSISVPAALHAIVRLDQKRKYKSTDFEDFRHAALAVGYCDAFMTESSLHHSLTSKHIDAERNFGCKVLSNEDEVLTYLRRLS